MAVLVDTGPLVAIIDRSDKNHKKCRDALISIHEPLCTVWPVITEAVYLLDFSAKAQNAILELIEREVTIVQIDIHGLTRVRELMTKYADLPMDLADAALVVAAEQTRSNKVLTLDARDFNIYRPKGFQRFEILP